MPVFRVLFLGMTNRTSAALLEALLGAGIDVCGVLLAAERASGPPIARVLPAHSPLPIANPFLEHTVVQIAWERGLPAFELREPGAPEALAQVADLRPDIACVACFSKRIPPALLPNHRGPAPLFWIFRSGEQAGGVTIHFMDAGLDTGDIAAQAPVALPDGISGELAEQRCDAIGARLMLDSLQNLRDGTLARRPQPAGGSYQPWPTQDDWRIPTSWTARRAFNFMRGTAEWGQPYLVLAGDRELALATAIAYHPDEVLGRAFVREDDQITIQFAAGTLRAREA
jgi:methionyl-tRNA formyltransferase